MQKIDPKAVVELAEHIKPNLKGEMKFDSVTKALYSTDASIYQIEPSGVITPKSKEDVCLVVETANQFNIPILSRGGGTSLAGQTVTPGIVMDFSKYMNNITHINREENTVTTQPGIIIDQLNNSLKHLGVHFAPDPSTSNRATIGGAIGNNSCGSHSILWGKTVDNVVSLQTILSDGSETNFGVTDIESLQNSNHINDLETRIYRWIIETNLSKSKHIIENYPKISRRVSGYNLDEITDKNHLNLAGLLVGSEGTLAAVTEAKVKVVHTPKHKALAIAHFSSLYQSMEATVEIANLEPSAIELVDKSILRPAKSNLGYSRLMNFVTGDPEAILIIEVNSDDELELNSKLSRVITTLKSSRLSYEVTQIIDPSEQAKVWAVRKAGLGLMMNVKGNSKPLPFVEDTAVDTALLPEYVKRFDEIVKEHGTSAGYYGHASVGCLHIRPLINLKVQDGIDKMFSISDSISDLVLEFGGSLSGEHGDGIVRSNWNKKMFGEDTYGIFKSLKTTFDPKSLMNPGKIVDSYKMTENLRISPEINIKEISGHFSFSEEGGFSNAIEMCNGQGACRKLDGGMCPSYMATLDEEHSTRGRANALRALISNRIPWDTINTKRMHDVLDLCLECKACKSECPSGVDMAKMKYEFLSKYYKQNRMPVRNKLFGNIAQFSKLGAFFAPISNWILSSDEFKSYLDSILGITKNRNLPPFATQTFNQWFKTREKKQDQSLNKIAIFIDTFTNYNYPNIGKAATVLLETLGYQVVIPKIKCCGKPFMSQGMTEKAINNATYNVNQLYEYVDAGIEILGLEPSCTLTLKEDYPDLIPNNPKAKALSQKIIQPENLIDQCIAQLNNENFTPPGSVFYQNHCHQKSFIGSAINKLMEIPNCQPIEVGTGCCGMAGSFGFEKEHYDISMKIGGINLFDQINSIPSENKIVASGISCRQQIEHSTNQKPQHLVEFLLNTFTEYTDLNQI